MCPADVLRNYGDGSYVSLAERCWQAVRREANVVLRLSDCQESGVLTAYWDAAARRDGVLADSFDVGREESPVQAIVGFLTGRACDHAASPRDLAALLPSDDDPAVCVISGADRLCCARKCELVEFMREFASKN